MTRIVEVNDFGGCLLPVATPISLTVNGCLLTVIRVGVLTVDLVLINS